MTKRIVLAPLLCLVCATAAEALMLSPIQLCRRHRLTSAPLPMTASDETGHTVEISYDGRSCDIQVQPNETLLDAMERAGVAHRLAVPSLPADCRRGNCLTCTGRHAAGSKESHLSQGEDGLTPYVSRQVRDAGYVLTCSSFVVGDGVKLDLGANDQAWNEMYRERLEDERAQYVGRKAMARVIRRSAEYNVEKWAKQTEEVLKKTTE